MTQISSSPTRAVGCPSSPCARAWNKGASAEWPSNGSPDLLRLGNPLGELLAALLRGFFNKLSHKQSLRWGCLRVQSVGLTSVRLRRCAKLKLDPTSKNHKDQSSMYLIPTPISLPSPWHINCPVQSAVMPRGVTWDISSKAASSALYYQEMALGMTPFIHIHWLLEIQKSRNRKVAFGKVARGCNRAPRVVATKGPLEIQAQCLLQVFDDLSSELKWTNRKHSKEDMPCWPTMWDIFIVCMTLKITFQELMSIYPQTTRK